MDSIAQTRKTLIVNPIITEHHKYCQSLLKLALSYSDTKYKFGYTSGTSSLERELVQLKEGKVDVIWTAASDIVEEEAQPIRVPLYRGLLGFRILLIRKGDQPRFEQIKTLDELKAFTFGQGEDWSDTRILVANGITVVPTRKYENLFFMLDGARFDAYPRGIYEPWSELQIWSELDLEVEKTIAIVYKMPMYFFVNKDNKALANEIERGLMKAIDDGSFNRHFFGDPVIKNALDKANIEKRKLFHLDNPDLPKTTPLDNPKLWWSPTS